MTLISPKVLVLALVLSACSSGPEIVAMDKAPASSKEDGGLHLGPLHQGCRVGVYFGTFATRPEADGAVVFPLDGQFTFELVEGRSGGGGEFPVLKEDSYLSGSNLDHTITFKGIVKSGGNCHDGQFQSEIADGSFQIQDGTEIPFTGAVLGVYDAIHDEFSGDWKIDPLGLSGRWSAQGMNGPKK